MHPIEHLRYVARAGAADNRVLLEETALALVSMADDVPGTVMSARRLIERNPSSGPLWTLCARVLCATDPAADADELVDEVARDTTARHLASALPPDARLTVLGWPEVAAEALVGRGDIEVLVVDARGEGLALARRLARADVPAEHVDEASIGPAVRASDVVLVEAAAAGPTAIVSTVGSYAAAAAASHAGVPVWGVVGAARALPGRAWDAVLARLDAATAARPWNADHDVVPADLLDLVVRPAGTFEPSQGLGPADGPLAPELLR